MLSDPDIICQSIVDVGKLKTSEFVFLISEYAGMLTLKLNIGRIIYLY